MKKIILLLSINLNIIYSHAQTSQAIKRDSLHQALQKEKTDTGRIFLLAELSFQLHQSKPDSAMALALEALTLSRRINFEKGEAVSLNRVGNVCMVLGNYPKAMEVFLQALKINEKIKNLDGIHRNYNNIGNIYNDQEDYRQALYYFFKAKTIAEQLNNQRSLSSACVNMAEAYHRLKIYLRRPGPLAGRRGRGRHHRQGARAGAAARARPGHP